ncbi:MAG: alpha/beta fold hydrolase [Trueperaceae bacterium]|nr:alpha/beta fold hydrolase [Trueperaceae bacterium]
MRRARPDVLNLEIRVTLATDEAGAGLTGTIDIPAQGLEAFPLADVVLDGDQIGFVMPGVPGDPTFVGTLDGDRIEGTFTQSGQAFPYFLERGDEPMALRPQEPLPPFPYDEEEVAFASGDVTLAGTLTLPPGDGRAPAVLLMTGSGPQDRNEEILGHKPFLVIADHLTRAGYAVLRVDDRGVGGSTGSDTDATYEELLGDVLAGVALLRDHPRVDPERVGLLGHSQGGFLAPAAAVEADGDVAFVILMAGPSVDGFQTLLAQNERIIELAMRAANPAVTDEAVADAVASQFAFLEALHVLLQDGDLEGARALVRTRVEEELEATPADRRPDDATIEQIIAANQAATASPSFRAFVLFDPRPYLEQLTVPTLAFFGGLDVQVLAEQNEGPMREALAAAGNPDATVVTFAGLNHLMQPATTGSVDEYGAIATTIDPIVLETITDWLQVRFPVR